MTSELIYDTSDDKYKRLFPAIKDVLMVVSALFDRNKVGIENFDIGGNNE